MVDVPGLVAVGGTLWSNISGRCTRFGGCGWDAVEQHKLVVDVPGLVAVGGMLWSNVSGRCTRFGGCGWDVVE